MESLAAAKQISQPFTSVRLVLASLKLLTLIVFCFGAILCSAVRAQGPENTVVVVNADSADSLAVANAYIELRDIPAVNVIYIKNVPRAVTSIQSTHVTKFEARIFKPILNALRDRRIENQIDCIAYSSNFPTRVSVQPQIDIHLGQTGRKSNKVLHARWASITSLTYFYRNAFGKRPDFFNLDANNFANPRQIKITANPFSGKDASQFNTAIKAMNAGDFDGAIDGLIKLARTHDKQLSVVYALARCFALKNENEKAITTLKHARTLGFASKSMLTTDKAFSGLRTLREFREITDSMEDLPDGIAPTRSFSSRNFWGTNGWANGTAQQGEQYTLSSVLAVVEKNASTLEDSLERLRDSAMADGTTPAGSVYFAEHKDVRSQARKGQFRFAKQELELLGRTATIGSSIVPKADPQVVGATLGSSRINWKKSGSRFVPGAICDNLTSYGGLWGQSQTQVSELLDAGAAGASGTVCEPYAIAPKFPSARWHAHYARGCTLAESFFQSVAGPSQLLLVGDPLCCPFGKFPDFQIRGMGDGDTVTGDFVLQIEPAPNSPKAKRYEMFYDGVFLGVVPNPDKVEVATDAMNDGYHELRIVGIADSPTANRGSRKVGFKLQRFGHSLSLNVRNSECRSGDVLRAKVDCSFTDKIQIQQNSRTVATVDSNQEFTISTSVLGLGKTKLQASATLANGMNVKSQPVPISLVARQKIQKHEKRKIPSSTALKEKVTSIRKLLKQQYRDISNEGCAELLRLLQEMASESISDPVNYYALLSECVVAASLFNSVEAGWSACDQLRSSYEVDELPHIGFIRQIKTKLDSKSASVLYLKGVQFTEQLIDNDYFADAVELTKTLSVALKKPFPLTDRELGSLVDRAEILNRKFMQIQPDLMVLRKNPSDKEANENIGRFYCLQKSDFEIGLPYLAKGPESSIQKLARNELRQNNASVQDVLLLANGWWEVGKDAKQKNFRILAATHYHKIFSKLNDLDKVEIENRLKRYANDTFASAGIVALIAKSTWKANWNHGTPWHQLRLTATHVVISNAEKTSSFSYKVNNNSVEFWNPHKTTMWRLSLTNDGVVFYRHDKHGKLVDSVQAELLPVQ